MSGDTISLEDRQRFTTRWRVMCGAWIPATSRVSSPPLRLTALSRMSLGKDGMLPRAAPGDLRRISSRVLTGVADSITSSIFLLRKPMGEEASPPLGLDKMGN